MVALWYGGCLTPSVMKKTFTILAIGSGLFLGQAQAEIESEFHVGYNSKYVFRCVDLGDDAYEYGLSLAGSGNSGLNWSAGFWGISPDGEDNAVDELDLFAEVSKEFGCVNVAAGFTVYTYPNGGQDDAEVYLGFSGNCYGIDTGVKVLFGTDGVFQEQILVEADLGYSYELSSTVDLNVGFVLGYIADDGQGVYAKDDGVAYYSASLSFDIALSDDITFSPYVSYVDGNGGTINVPDMYIEDGVIGGARLSFSF